MRREVRMVVGTVVGLLAMTGLPYLLYAAAAALVPTSGSPAEKRDWEPTVSVVIPTYNEADIIEQRLAHLLDVAYPLEKLEVVIADASDDGTPDVVESFFADRDAPSLTLLHDDERRGVAPALNDAFAAASGDVVFRTDADSRLGRDTIREAVRNLADERIGAVTGRQSEVIGESEVESDYRNILTRIQLLESRLDSTFIFHGPCFAFRREEFVPIDPNSLADDTELALRIRRGGKRVVVDPAMTFAESAVSDFRKRRQRKDRRAMGLLKLLVQQRDALGRYGLYGWVVLPFNWWFMIVSPWLLTLAASVATVGSALLAGPLSVPLFAVAAGGWWLGQRDALGPLQPLYAVFDAQVSLVVAMVRLLSGDSDGIWEVDRASREAFRADE